MTTTIVVGAGAAGAPLAARLSDDPDRRVVVLEAGPTPRRFPDEVLDGSTVQAAAPGHRFNWSYPATLAPGRPYRIARGRIAGGSSAINGGYFVRPRPADLDGWAALGGHMWSAERALPVFEGLERALGVRKPAQDGTLVRAFTAAALERGFPLEPDKNAFGPPGVGPVPSTIVDGVRRNTALAFLDPVAARANLVVRGDTPVRRVVIEAGRAVGVETDGGVVHADEVILCAGAIASAQLLQVSGIGPTAVLSAAGVEVVADLPVGESFSDHPDIAVGWRARPGVEEPPGSPFPTALSLDSSGEARIHPDGDLELLLAIRTLGHLLTGSEVAPGRQDELQVIVGLQAPVARGVLAIRTPAMSDPPAIDYRYLADEADRTRLRTGVRLAADLLRAAPFEDVFAGFTDLDERALDDDRRLDAWIVAHLGTAIHLCGTAPFGSVVDGAGRVAGIDGLRVADTSILPIVPSRGPFASAILVGELIGRLVRDG